jgi:hypothetical protein
VIDAVDQILGALRDRFKNFSIAKTQSDRVLSMEALDNNAVVRNAFSSSTQPPERNSLS